MQTETQVPVPVVYRPKDLQKLLLLSRGTVYRLLADGTIPSWRLGRRILISKTAISRLLESMGPE